ncbi:GAF and ANTAR domain-containing protein [Conyzicola lurida]
MFVTLADVADSDAGIVEVLHELSLATLTIPAVGDTGILLADSAGELHVVASSSERADHIQMLQLGAGSGPCIECFTTGLPVNVDDIGTAATAWPDYYRAARRQNVRAVHALPLRLRDHTIGAMSIFSEQTGDFSDQDAALAQALADAATIAILQIRTRDTQRRTEEQLKIALESRVLIEQAKGIVAGGRKIPVDDAFELLRSYARANQAKLHEVAQLVVDHRLTL